MHWPWSALVDQLGRSLAVDPRGRSDDEAWEETAARLGLIRLGWIERHASGGPLDAVGGAGGEIVLAFPCIRAIARWRAARALGAGQLGMAGSGEEIVSLDRPSGQLIAGSLRGKLPSKAALDEVAALAAALRTRRRDRQMFVSALARARAARRVGAAAHDLRNELTRAMLLAARATEPDLIELRSVLECARVLAQEAMLDPDGPNPNGLDPTEFESAELDESNGARRKPLISIELAALLANACRAASMSARSFSGSKAPRLRMRCPRGLRVLAEPAALDRALRNVVSNALEAAAKSHNPAEVRVSAAQLDGSDLAASTRWAQAMRPAGFDVRLAIEDDGVGMGSREVRMFLDPRSSNFAAATEVRKGRHSHANDVASTGLGTASLQLALDASGTPLRVSSELGVGTVVEMFFRSQTPSRVILDRDHRRGRRGARDEAGAVYVASRAAAALLR